MKPKSLPSRLFDRRSASDETPAKYQRHVDHQESLYHSGHNDSQPVADGSGLNEKSHRQVHFAFLPERYEPLVDEEAKEEKKKRKKEKYKKVKKQVSPFLFKEETLQETIVFTGLSVYILGNVGKALRCTWKCLMLGLYNFALGYSTPITVAATFVPDFHPGRNTT